jgi:hypothetical protein
MTETNLDLLIEAIVDLPADLDDEEARARWDAGLPARSPAEARARELYERLYAGLQDLPDVEPLPGWEERAVARWRRERDGARAP